MKTQQWFSLLSIRQRAWLFGTVACMLAIIVTGIVLNPPANTENVLNVNIDMSIRDIAPKLNVTGKALARELDLPLDVSRQSP